MMGRKRETYPNLSGNDAKRRIVETARADDRFDLRQSERQQSDQRLPVQLSRKRSERGRVRSIIAKDKLERDAERARKEAELELSEGSDKVSLSDVALGPTTEQINRAGPDGFEQVAEVGTGKNARLGATVFRRRACPVAWKMRFQGVIDRKGYEACVWYRGVYEATGLSGTIPSTDYSKEVFSAPHARAMFADWQEQQQDLYRAIRAEITDNLLRILDAMVLKDVSVHRAAREARTGHRDPKACFENAVAELVDVRKKIEG